MKKPIHREITLQALGGYFSASALETVIAANLGQDALRYQVGHDHFHYDASAFARGDAYCEELRRGILGAVHESDSLRARTWFGRLTHTVQDLYAHSNYVALWCESHPDAPAGQIEPQSPAILGDPRLHSGKLYYPLEALSFIAALKPYVVPLLPSDSHAWMNIDEASRPGFEYAYAAASKRTVAEYVRLAKQLSPAEVACLTGKE